MKKIYKYILEITDFQTVEIPGLQLLLGAQFQNGQLCVWALVDPDKLKSNIPFWIFGTGNPLSDVIEDIDYFKTVQQGPLVWHIFTN